jgi:hypothetical protein
MPPSWMGWIASMLAWASSWYARSRCSVACGMSSQIFTGPRWVSATTVRLPFGRTHVLAVGGVGGDTVAPGDQGGLPEEQIGREMA